MWAATHPGGHKRLRGGLRHGNQVGEQERAASSFAEQKCHPIVSCPEAGDHHSYGVGQVKITRKETEISGWKQKQKVNRREQEIRLVVLKIKPDFKNYTELSKVNLPIFWKKDLNWIF